MPVTVPPLPATQTQAERQSRAQAAANAAIVEPLYEIGRVKARTPYCAALNRARTGIDAAVAFEYVIPVVAKDLRDFHHDSYLTREKSRTKTAQDLSKLWSIALFGRAEVVALRQAANAAGVDEPRREAMIALANAVDGAKARQMMLAKQLARSLAVFAEMPVLQIADTATDQNAVADPLQRPGFVTTMTALNQPSPILEAMTADAQDYADLQQLFNTFAAEDFIRDDLKTAAKHATDAMQLGNCGGV